MDKQTLQLIKEVCQNTLIETLEIEFVKTNIDEVVATMPVTSKVHQPDGVLHGGASVALAETVGSFASLLNINREKQIVRGIEISANHLRSKRDGVVTAIATPLHKGKTTQLWQIRIEDEQNRLISLCKLSTIILANRQA